MSELLPHEKGFHVSWDQLHRDARALSWRLDGQGPGTGAWKAVVAITRGGMAPAMIVARELDIRTVDTISVKSYNHQTQAEPKVIKPPNSEIITPLYNLSLYAKNFALTLRPFFKIAA